MGVPTWWLGFTDHDYLSTKRLTFYHFYKGYSLTESLEADRPDYLIVDNDLRRVLVDEGYFRRGAGFSILLLPKREFETFLAERGTQVMELDDRWHGKLEVYAIDWEDAHPTAQLSRSTIAR